MRVTVRMSWEHKPHEYSVEIGRREIEEAFAPLPRDRECWWAGDAAKIARDMVKRREEIINHIARLIAIHILEAVKTEDPHYGYSAREWAEMHPCEAGKAIKQ